MHLIKYAERTDSTPRPNNLRRRDYRYLKYSASTLAWVSWNLQDENLSSGFRRLLATKPTNFTTIAATIQSIQNVLYEISTNHRTFFTQWGVDERGLEESLESTKTTAYGACIMDIGFQGDPVKSNAALSARTPGHGEVGLLLVSESKRPGRWVITGESLDS